ncbi:hypothetical protein FRAAL2520 [Frankia alni ACN14a]|uniref:Uncharacterized protein n=1 Tax=Frankia alni (strain DSM 45986 / CECT 9034 / ACN14a) TaxID=326424 RepID=Q0RMT0_FRAAA|nr:hypothetical protein FRAAL2520 [Frankia alni ACN14a]
MGATSTTSPPHLPCRVSYPARTAAPAGRRRVHGSAQNSPAIPPLTGLPPTPNVMAPNSWLAVVAFIVGIGILGVRLTTAPILPAVKSTKER